MIADVLHHFLGSSKESILWRSGCTGVQRQKEGMLPGIPHFYWDGKDWKPVKDESDVRTQEGIEPPPFTLTPFFTVAPSPRRNLEAL